MTAKLFLKSMAKFSIGSWINFLIGFFSVMIMTRVFSPELYGVINLFNATSGMIVGIACLGMDSSLLRFYNEPPEGWTSQDVFVRCLVISIFSLVIISAISLGCFYQEISLHLFDQISFFLTALIFLNALSALVLNSFFANHYRMKNDAYHYTIQQVLVQFFSKIFILCAVFISPTVDVVILFNVAGMTVLLLAYLVVQRKRIFPDPIHLSYKNFLPLAKFAFFSWPLSFVLSFNTFATSYLIVSELDPTALGIFTSAGFFVSAFAVIQAGFRTYWASFMYAHYNSEKTLIKRVHNYVNLTAIFIFGGFILCQHIVYLMIGADFHSSRLFFSLVLLEPLYMLLEQTTEYGMSIKKRNQEVLVIYFIGIILNLGLVYFLLPIVGVIGAAIASAGGALIRYGIATWRGQTYYRSIERKSKTITGAVLILRLAISNCLFAMDYWIEVCIVFSVFLISIIVYKKDLEEVVFYVRS